MHWSQGYIGLPYVPASFDCADLVERVAREIFGRTVSFPKERPEGRRSAGYRDQLDRDMPTFFRRLTVADNVVDGDVVRMIGAGRANHIGLVAMIAAEVWVLHNFIRARQVVLQRARDLPQSGLAIEGFYRWI